MTVTATTHPAKFSDAIIATISEVLVDYVDMGARILDPFAGTGKIHELRDGYHTHGIEIEPEWAAMHPYTDVGDALHLEPTWTGVFDAVVTSPCYGNRMADHHEANDACNRCNGAGSIPRWAKARSGAWTTCAKCGGSGLSPRKTYKHALGRNPSEGSSAVMQWGDEYREFHRAAWAEVYRVLKPRGIFVLNIKDHIRDGKRMRVSDWHRRTIESVGFERLETVTVSASGMRHGENHEARVPHELLYVFERDRRQHA